MSLSMGTGMGAAMALGIGTGAGNVGVASARLVHSAHEFEASLMKELMKPLVSSSSLSGDDDDGGSNGALGEFAGEALAQAISERGGFGIADKILGQLAGREDSAGKQPGGATAGSKFGSQLGPKSGTLIRVKSGAQSGVAPIAAKGCLGSPR